MHIDFSRWTYKNPINHVLINNRLKNCIKNLKTTHEADMDSDHLLIWMKVKMKTFTNHKLRKINRYNVDKLDDQRVYKEYT